MKTNIKARPLVLSDLEPAANVQAQVDPDKPTIGQTMKIDIVRGEKEVDRVVTSVTLVTSRSIMLAAINPGISDESTLAFKDHSSRPFVVWVCETKEAP